MAVAAMAYINMSYEDIAPQKEEQEIKHVSDVITTSRTCFLLEI
ncbi:hypothetical protein [Lysinibacillus fusiformis]